MPDKSQEHNKHTQLRRAKPLTVLSIESQISDTESFHLQPLKREKT